MKRLLVFLSALAAVVALAGCGSSSGSGGSDPDPAKAVPANVPLYLELVVRPEGKQREDVRAFAGKVLQTDDPQAKIRSLVDKALSSNGGASNYEKDVAPWLGRRAGLYVTNLQRSTATAVVAVAARDPQKAADAIKQEAARTHAAKSTHNGVTIYDQAKQKSVAAPVGEYVLFGNNAADLYPAIDTLKGKPSLADSDRYKQAIARLPGDRMGTVYLDFRQILTAVMQQATAQDPSAGAVFRAFGTDKLNAGAAALLIDADRASIEAHTKSSGSVASQLGLGGGASSLVREAPEGSFAAIGLPKLGQTARSLFTSFAGAFGGPAATTQIEQETGLNLDNDVFGWIGDVVLFARGTNPSNADGGLIIAVTDKEKAAAALPKLVGLARQQAKVTLQPFKLDGADQAYKAALPGSQKPLVVALGGDRAVIAAGVDTASAALKGDKTIEDSGLYGRAKDAIDGIDPAFLVDGPGIVRFLTAADSDPKLAQAKPYLDMIDVIAGGSKTSGGDVRTRVAVKLR